MLSVLYHSNRLGPTSTRLNGRLAERRTQKSICPAQMLEHSSHSFGKWTKRLTMPQLEQVQSGPQWHPLPEDEQPQSISMSGLSEKIKYVVLIQKSG